MKILFITTHNLASNPRLVKEVRLALQLNYRVEVICFEFENWSFPLNVKLKNEFNKAGVILHVLQAGRHPFMQWFISVVAEKACRILNHLFELRLGMLAIAVTRRSVLLNTSLKKVQSADWVIGHNPGSLLPVYNASKRFKCKAGFDIEDYYPGEGANVHLQGLTKRLMQKLLPKMDYVTFGSPLIKEQVKSDLKKEGNNWLTILNYFSSFEFVNPSYSEGVVKLVWFSQNIAAGRGLEWILPMVKDLKGIVELHLFGNLTPAFNEVYINQIENVIVHKPLSQYELHHQLSNFDIGLALEPSKDKNNELAISNKMLAYLQAGLYILASNTAAQKVQLQTFQEHGLVVDINSFPVYNILQDLAVKINWIRANKLLRYKKFDDINWEKESCRLVEVWKR